MVVPGLVLPVPIFEESEFSINYVVSDAHTGVKLWSAKGDTNIIGRGTAFSLYGLFSLNSTLRSDLAEFAAEIIDKDMMDVKKERAMLLRAREGLKNKQKYLSNTYTPQAINNTLRHVDERLKVLGDENVNNTRTAVEIMPNK